MKIVLQLGHSRSSTCKTKQEAKNDSLRAKMGNGGGHPHSH